MFKTKSAKTSIPNQSYATIQENALILSFTNSENPVISRFDLDMLAQANFTVQQISNMYHLELRDLTGKSQLIAQFVNKIDAHQALQHILHALVNHHSNQADRQKKSKLKIFFGLMYKTILIVVLLIVLLLLFAKFVPNKHQMNNGSIPSSNTQLPDGTPVNIDDILLRHKD